MNRFVHAASLVSLVIGFAVATGGCAADTDGPAEAEEVGSTESSLIRGGGGLNESGSSRCYMIECPGDGLESCFVPCMQRKGTTRSACVSACQCKSIEITCKQTSIF